MVTPHEHFHAHLECQVLLCHMHSLTEGCCRLWQIFQEQKKAAEQDPCSAPNTITYSVSPPSSQDPYHM